MSNLLSVENLTMQFGGLIAIDDLSFNAKNNQITSIIGPNGARPHKASRHLASSGTRP